MSPKPTPMASTAPTKAAHWGISYAGAVRQIVGHLAEGATSQWRRRHAVIAGVATGLRRKSGRPPTPTRRGQRDQRGVVRVQHHCRFSRAFGLGSSPAMPLA
jgi:hypothetical protein